MSYELKKEGHVKGLGTIFYVSAPFDEQMNLFKQEGLKLITVRDLAFARIQNGENSSLSQQDGNRMKEGVLYFPNEKDKTVLVRSSAVLKSYVKATEAHRQRKEFFLTEKAANEYLERIEAEKDSVHVLKNKRSIPTNRFGEDERTVWLFQDQAQEYGSFLEDSDINSVLLYFDSSSHIKRQGKPYANLLSFGGLGRINASYLSGVGRYLGDYDEARGVRTVESCYTKKKVVEAYTPKQISSALKELKMEGLEKQLLEAVTEIIRKKQSE